MEHNAEKLGNLLIDALNSSVSDSVSNRFEKVVLDIKDILYDIDQPITEIYFPVNGVVSWVQEVGEDKLIEVATVGNEGFAGVPILLGAERTPGKSFSQIPGNALKISTKDFREMLTTFPQFSRLLHRYVQALLVEISQGAACNGSHPVEQRCARWLLTTHDRVGSSSFYLTQEFLAQMLGVRRGGVNETAQALQDAGIIRYARGQMTILDRPALEARSCVCYGIVRKEFREMIGGLD